MVAERLQALEKKNRQLAEELAKSSKEHENQVLQFEARLKELSTNIRTDGAASGIFESGDEIQRDGFDSVPDNPEYVPFAGPDGMPMVGVGNVPTGDFSSPVPDYTEGMFAPFTPAPGFPGSNVTSPYNMPLIASFGPGFQLQTKDEQFRLQIHYESQIEGRIWEQSRQQPANSGFFLPRQRVFFDGNITRQVEYELSINRGLNNINLLNAFLNFHFDDRFEVRVGRFFTPFPYDQYAISNYWLLTPERSLFTTNLSLNRQIGAMAWGYLFEKRLDYAVGAFNGSRNSFESLHNGVDLVAYLNARPFQESEWLPAIRFLNIGTSLAYGKQGQTPIPPTFRIGAGSADSNIPSTATTPFLILNPDVIEKGDRLLGSVHLAYFFRSLSLIGEWQYGHAGYANNARPAPVDVPFSGFYVSGGYFLTGEQVERRTRVRPLRPFVPLNRDEERGPGAWEAVARVSKLHIGKEIFDGGFADPSIWSNSALTTELGANWYWNDYMKVYMFWLHGDFADPVQFRPGGLQRSADMVWLRCQLYF